MFYTHHFFIIFTFLYSLQQNNRFETVSSKVTVSCVCVCVCMCVCVSLSVEVGWRQAWAAGGGGVRKG